MAFTFLKGCLNKTKKKTQKAKQESATRDYMATKPRVFIGLAFTEKTCRPLLYNSSLFPYIHLLQKEIYVPV